MATLATDTNEDLEGKNAESEDWRNAYKDIPETSYKDIFEAPGSFEEAWNHPDLWQRDRWRKAIAKEFKKMEERQVWKKVSRSSMPKGRRCVKHKWVLEIKRNGVFRARLVAKGFSQVPGVDYTEVFSPVSNDVTFRIMLLCAIRYGWTSLLMDVETAFLLGKLEEEIYMECPEGMESKEDEVLLLLQTIYGLVQSAREFFKYMVKVLKKLGFEQSAADPCLLVCRNEKGTVMISLYVDDCYIVGDKEAVSEFVDQIKATELTVKLEYGLKDYLSCEIAFDQQKTKAWIGQPHMIKKLDKKFGKAVSGLQEYKTPGTPGVGLSRPKEGEPTLAGCREAG